MQEFIVVSFLLIISFVSSSALGNTSVAKCEGKFSKPTCTEERYLQLGSCAYACICDGEYSYYVEETFKRCGPNKRCYQGDCLVEVAEVCQNFYGSSYIGLEYPGNPCTYYCYSVDSPCIQYEEARPYGTACYTYSSRQGQCFRGRCALGKLPDQETAPVSNTTATPSTSTDSGSASSAAAASVSGSASSAASVSGSASSAAATSVSGSASSAAATSVSSSSTQGESEEGISSDSAQTSNINFFAENRNDYASYEVTGSSSGASANTITFPGLIPDTGSLAESETGAVSSTGFETGATDYRDEANPFAVSSTNAFFTGTNSDSMPISSSNTGTGSLSQEQFDLSFFPWNTGGVNFGLQTFSESSSDTTSGAETGLMSETFTADESEENSVPIANFFGGSNTDTGMISQPNVGAGFLTNTEPGFGLLTGTTTGSESVSSYGTPAGIYGGGNANIGTLFGSMPIVYDFSNTGSGTQSFASTQTSSGSVANGESSFGEANNFQGLFFGSSPGENPFESILNRA